MLFQEFTAAITAAKAVKTTAKLVMDISKEFDQIDLKMKVIELVNQIGDLSDQLIELREKARLRDDYAFHKGVYWRLGPEAEGHDGRPLMTDEEPFCPRCYDVDGNAVHMQSINMEWHGKMFQCPQCKHMHPREGYPPG
jgi:hypothetical protein